MSHTETITVEVESEEDVVTVHNATELPFMARHHIMAAAVRHARPGILATVNPFPVAKGENFHKHTFRVLKEIPT